MDRNRIPSIHLLPNCSPTPRTRTNMNEEDDDTIYFRPSSSRSNFSTNTSSSNAVDSLTRGMTSMRIVSSSSNHSNYSTYSTPSTTSSLSTPDIDTSFITTSRGGHSSLNPPSPTYFPTTRRMPVHQDDYYYDPEMESTSKRNRIRESTIGLADTIRSCHPPTNKCRLPVCPECGAFVRDRIRDFKDGIWYWYWCCGGTTAAQGSKEKGCGKVFWFPGKAEVKKV